MITRKSKQLVRFQYQQPFTQIPTYNEEKKKKSHLVTTKQFRRSGMKLPNEAERDTQFILLCRCAVTYTVFYPDFISQV